MPFFKSVSRNLDMIGTRIFSLELKQWVLGKHMRSCKCNSCFLLLYHFVSNILNKHRSYPVRCTSIFTQTCLGWEGSIMLPKEDVVPPNTKIELARWVSQLVGMITVKSASTGRIAGGLDVSRNASVSKVRLLSFPNN